MKPETQEEMIVDIQEDVDVDASNTETTESSLDLLQPSVDKTPPKIIDDQKELQRFRGQRSVFVWIVLGVIVIHNIATIMVMLYVLFTSHLIVNLDIIIPSYFVNVTAQVFVLMRAFAVYFDKAEFIRK